MAKVGIKNVGKIYPGDVRAVLDFNLEIADGEFVVLVGPSGCGKSTVLRMVAGLEEISSGVVSIGDRVVNDVLPKDRDIAMVFQNYALYPHMSVRDNMAFGLKLRKHSAKEIEERVGNAAEILNLTSYLDRRPKALSGGQRQRVAVGRAIVRKPAVFLFDEPLSNLDAKLRVQMRIEISRLHKTLESTMIYVTHDQVEAMTMGDRIVVMNDGVIQQIDSPIRLYDNPANKFVAGFIGTPPMNFFDGQITDCNGDIIFTADAGFSIPVHGSAKKGLNAYIGEKITMGVRPEDIGAQVVERCENAPRITAQVDIVEQMGCESFIHLTAGMHNFISRANSHERFVNGQTVEMPVFLEKVHFFDGKTGKAVKS